METIFTNRTIVITGATGLIGSCLTHELLKKGAKVIAIGRDVNKMKDVFLTEIDNPQFSYLIGNLSTDLLAKIGKIDYVFHAASPIAGEDIKYHPVDVIAANIDGVRICLDFLYRQKEQNTGCARMVVFSSATVYGKAEEEMNVSEFQTNCAENLNEISAPYSEAKRMVEVIAKAYNRQYGVDCVIARIGYVYGYTKASPATAFYEFIDRGIHGEDIYVNNAGTPRRDNIYVMDVVKGLMCIAEKGESGEAYNISSNGEKGNYCAIDELGDYIVKQVNSIGKKDISLKIKSQEIARKPGIKLNNNKLKKIGWTVETSIEDGIRETLIAYYKKGYLENK